MDFLFAVLAAMTTIVVLSLLLRSRFSHRIQDVPNERSLHAVPTPRIGGIGLMSGVAVAWVFQPGGITWWLGAPMILLFTVSLMDDVLGLSVRARLAVQLLAAAMFVIGSGLFHDYGFVVALLLLILIVWMTNLYNFMDGSDGLAGGMAMFGFTVYGVAAMQAGNYEISTLSFSVSAAALGFLFYNFPPAKLFMGDAGSIPLGFAVAALGLMGWQQGCWEIWLPLLAFSPFLVDAGVTLVRRSLRGIRITEAHREHYYQRAVQMGYGHRKVVFAEYSLMAASGASALLASQQKWEILVLVSWLFVYAMIMSRLDNKWKLHEKN